LYCSIRTSYSPVFNPRAITPGCTKHRYHPLLNYHWSLAFCRLVAHGASVGHNWGHLPRSFSRYSTIRAWGFLCWPCHNSITNLANQADVLFRGGGCVWRATGVLSLHLNFNFNFLFTHAERLYSQRFMNVHTFSIRI
jgi:hypothetical protein